jgi:NTP pyrophosphatase (non-canonical NTP hydrolase)
MGALNELAAEIHQTAEDKGWWEEGIQFGQRIALIHSELSEALEAWRKEENPWFYTLKDIGEEHYKPEGVAVELVDVIIRVLDILHFSSEDIDNIMRAKMEYNKTRPYRHGGLRA